MKDKSMTDELKKFLLLALREHPSFDDLLNHPWIKGPNNEYLNFIKKSLVEFGYSGPVNLICPEKCKYIEEVLDNILVKDFFDKQLKIENIDSKENIDDLCNSILKNTDNIDITKLEIIANRYNQNVKKIHLNSNSHAVKEKINYVFINYRLSSYEQFFKENCDKFDLNEISKYANMLVSDMDKFVFCSEKDSYYSNLNSLREDLEKVKAGSYKSSSKRNARKRVKERIPRLAKEILSQKNSFKLKIDDWIKTQLVDRDTLERMESENKKILKCVGPLYETIDNYYYVRDIIIDVENPEKTSFCGQMKKFFDHVRMTEFKNLFKKESDNKKLKRTSSEPKSYGKKFISKPKLMPDLDINSDKIK